MNQYQVTARGYTIEQVEAEARADAVSVLGTHNVVEVSRSPFERVSCSLKATFIFEDRSGVQQAAA